MLSRLPELCCGGSSASNADTEQLACGYSRVWREAPRKLSRLTSMDAARLGCCQAGYSKDQDRCVEDLDQAMLSDTGVLVHSAGVLDGHGSTNLAVDSAQSLLLPRIRSGLERVLAVHDKPHGAACLDACQAHIRESFQSVHNEIGQRRKPGERTGTTATIVSVIVSDKTQSATGEVEPKVLCACVGDSRAILVAPGGKVVEPMSIDHNMNNPDEVQRICETSRRHMLETGNIRTSFMVRRASPDGVECGPLALFKVCGAPERLKVYENASSGDLSVRDRLELGISTLVTRALGDQHASRSISCIPEIAAFGCPVGSRIIIASDGMWDVVSSERAAALVRRIRDPRLAARKLVATARRSRQYAGRSNDDIAVVVLDVAAPFAELPSVPSAVEEDATTASLSSSSEDTTRTSTPATGMSDEANSQMP